MNKTLAILGSTGSIGTQSLEVCRKMGYQVVGLTANSNYKLLEKQAREFIPRCVACKDKTAFEMLKSALSDTNIMVLCGNEGISEIAQMPSDIVLNAIVGLAGFVPTMKAIESGHDIALANKETLVAGGKLVIESAKKHKVKIFPVDSEHSAIFQCMQGANDNKISKIILTASGGPFHGKSFDQLESMTIKDALNHPNWSMGAKITIDSATLMNKGLEFIEAMWLFDLQPNQIEVVIHRESIVHSAIEFEDGAVIAQMGVPDMKIPIQYALTYPNRTKCDVKKLSLTDIGKLTFEKPDMQTFKCLPLAIEAIKKGGLYPCAVNSANEQAVSMFLKGKISFNDISRAIEHILYNVNLKSYEYSIESILKVDRMIRTVTEEYLSKGGIYH
ncbi:MAG: 1-deoxy-D-xylulose-5-phosphate reductoisomerase [Oscillospiraceae bacterium]